MAIEVWPVSTVPLKIRFGLERDFLPEGNVAISDFELGPIRQRQRFAGVIPEQFNCELMFDGLAVDLFAKWVKEDLSYGTKPFLANIPTGSTIQTCRVQFISQGKKIRGEDYNFWTMTATLEVKVLDVLLDEAAFWALSFFGTTELLHIMDVLQYQMNTHIPTIIDTYY
jgi:hypothetical protein